MTSSMIRTFSPARVGADRPNALTSLHGVPDDAIIRSLAAWTRLFGAVSFEVFSRLTDIVEDTDAVFDQWMRDINAFVGIIESESSAVPEMSPKTSPSIR
jgi:hypothetical protein